MHGDYIISIDDWLEETEIGDKRRFKLLKGLIAGKDILDFGCGGGGFLNLCRLSARSGSGIELERRLIEYWRGKIKKHSYWSQHLFLYNSLNLKKIAELAGFQEIVVKHIQRYPLSNNLYWLSQGKPAGHNNYLFPNQVSLNSAYESALASIVKTDILLLFAKK